MAKIDLSKYLKSLGDKMGGLPPDARRQHPAEEAPEQSSQEGVPAGCLSRLGPGAKMAQHHYPSYA